MAPTSDTLAALLEFAAASNEGVRFLDRGGSSKYLSYAELYSRARQASSVLEAAGVRPGDRVAVVTRSSPAFYDAFFGTVCLGAVPVPLYPPVRFGAPDDQQRRLTHALRTAQCRLVVAEPHTVSLLGTAVADAGVELGLRVLECLEAPERAAHVSRPEDVALIQFSSGTTGLPKGVRLTHRQIFANLRAIHRLVTGNAAESEAPRHVGASWLPLYHDMGLIGCVFTALLHPAELVLIPPEVFLTDPAIWLSAIDTYRVTVSPAPNFAFAYCAQRIDEQRVAGLDLSSWRVALNGAEAVTRSAMARFVARFGSCGLRPEALTPVYGLAEAGLIVCASPADRPPRFDTFDSDDLQSQRLATPCAATAPRAIALASVGKPVAGFAIELRTGGGAAAGERRIGRIWIRGPSVMDGYEGTVKASELDSSRWLDTGDAGFIHDGELFIYGRCKDLFVVRGRNYAPEPFEQAAGQVTGVRRGRVAAFGVADDETGTESVVLVAERDPRARVSDPLIQRAISRRTSAETGLRPRDVRMVAPGWLPRTSNGKVQRARAKALYLGELAGAGAALRDLPLLGAQHG